MKEKKSEDENTAHEAENEDITVDKETKVEEAAGKEAHDETVTDETVEEDEDIEEG